MAQLRRDLENLDLLRTLAVLVVVVAHMLDYSHNARDWIPWFGVSGVYLFFVHTALVLMWSLERDPHTARFYLRRVFRIFPLWLVVLAAYIVFRIPGDKLPPYTLHYPHGWELVGNALLLSNFHWKPCIPVAWSLCTEIQMYLFLPFLFFFTRSTRQLWPLIVADVFAMFFAKVNDDSLTQLLVYIPCFIPGVMAYLQYSKVRARLPAWSFALFLALLTFYMARYGNPRHAWVSCLILGLLLPHFKQVRLQGLNRATHLIARYSYGIYLTHIISYSVAFHVLIDWPIAAKLSVFTLLFLGLPIILYHMIEKPMIVVGSKLAARIESGQEPPVDEMMLSAEPAP